MEGYETLRPNRILGLLLLGFTLIAFGLLAMDLWQELVAPVEPIPFLEVGDPAQRQQASGQLRQLERAARFLARLDRLRSAEVSVASAYPLLALLLDPPDDAPHRRALADLLDTMTAASTDYRAIKPQVLPLDIRRTFSILSRQFERLEETSYVSLKLLGHGPASAADARWTEPVAQMRRTVDRLRLINQIPEWMARVKAINPTAGTGLYKQLRASAADLLKPENAEHATAALREMEKQLALFERLAGEGKAHLEPVQSEALVRSQQGAVKFKRRWLLARAAFLSRRGVAVPSALRQADVAVPRKLAARFAHFERNRWFSRAVWRARIPLVVRLWLLRAAGMGLTGPPRVAWRRLREVLKQRRSSKGVRA